jgi:HK97 family phage prohead protease
MPNDLMTFLADQLGAELRASLIGKFMLHQMAKRGMSARKAADAAGISVSTLYDYISGRIVNPPPDRLAAIAGALSLPTQAFEFLRSADVIGADAASALDPVARRGEGDDEEPEATRPEDEAGREPDDPDFGEPAAPTDEPEPEAEVTAAIGSGAVFGEVEGYASLFDKRDAKGTTMAPGAFAATIRAAQTRHFFWEHSHSLPNRGTSTPVGVIHALAEDSLGLWFRALVADTPKGREFMTLLEVGEIAGQVMGASVGGDPMEWQPGLEGGETRVFQRGVDKPPGRILSFDLIEISAAAFPALAGAFTRIARGDLASQIDASTDRIARILGG